MVEKNETPRDFLATLRYWWSIRPRLVLCENCGRPLWVAGDDTGGPLFCGQECAETGLGLWDDDEWDLEF